MGPCASRHPRVLKHARRRASPHGERGAPTQPWLREPTHTARAAPGPYRRRQTASLIGELGATSSSAACPGGPYCTCSSAAAARRRTRRCLRARVFLASSPFSTCPQVKWQNLQSSRSKHPFPFDRKGQGRHGRPTAWATEPTEVRWPSSRGTASMALQSSLPNRRPQRRAALGPVVPFSGRHMRRHTDTGRFTGSLLDSSVSSECGDSEWVEGVSPGGVAR
mmetsp:Transcript_43476/g.94701  ORF Transcript_43476/g.94701 Transcript_43476/m.94701 type:complete len:222 (-) Transcript_43476:289-954(-)